MESHPRMQMGMWGGTPLLGAQEGGLAAGCIPATKGKFGREQWNLWRARQGVALHGQVPLHPHPTSVSPGEPKSL